ncbi:hypothetical protein D3C86_1623770 [compost metagenome]
MPLVILPTMSSLRLSILGTSTLTSPTVMPWSARWCEAFSNSSEEASRALDGMQPTFRQVPPRRGSPLGSS